MYHYKTKGVCSRLIEVNLTGDIIESVSFEGGCDGNLKCVSTLVKGKSVEEVANLLEGTTCGPRPTSCGDQLVKALKEAQLAK